MMLFFDLDDTLLDHQRAQRLAALAWYRELGAEARPYSEEIFLAVWREAAIRNWAAFQCGEVSFEEHRRRRVREVLHSPRMSDHNADRHFERYVPHYEANWQLFDDVWPMLEQLRGYRLGIVTHGDAAQQRQKLARLKLEGHFERVIVVGETSRVATTSDAFGEAARLAQMSPVQCLYVGDSLRRGVLAARKAGWRAVWLERSRMLLGPHDVERVTSLREVPPLVTPAAGGDGTF